VTLSTAVSPNVKHGLIETLSTSTVMLSSGGVSYHFAYSELDRINSTRKLHGHFDRDIRLPSSYPPDSHNCHGQKVSEESSPNFLFFLA
jgi:hypothetical protein